MTSNSSPSPNKDEGSPPQAATSSENQDIRALLSLVREGISPKTLLRHLVPSFHLPPEADDTMAWRLLISSLDPPKRPKLRQYNKITDAVELIKTSKNIVVLSGAGISTSAGIPDFRSRDGIYRQIHEKYPDLHDPKSMFDISYFRKNPLPFFQFAKALFPGQYEPTIGHKFIKCIEDHGTLLRNYSQNIDTLERQTGIKRVVECHGSFAKATCTSCGFSVDGEIIKEEVLAQTVPKCPECHGNVNQVPLDGLGVMKPNIVFFGEQLGDEFHRLLDEDKGSIDLLIVIGSSLKVRPVANIPRSVPSYVPQILINREPLDHMQFDIELLGDCDVVIQELCLRLGGEWMKICNQDCKLLNELTGFPIQTNKNLGNGDDKKDDLAFEGSSNINDDLKACSVSSEKDDVTKDNETQSKLDEEIKRNIGDEDDEDDWEDVEILDDDHSDSSELDWQSNANIRIQDGVFHFIEPSVYLFKGVELNKAQVGKLTKDKRK